MSYEKPYLDEIARLKKQSRVRVFVESLLLLVAILAYCLVMAWMQNKDAQAKLSEMQKDQKRICQIKQDNAIHQFQCVVISEKYAII